MPADSTGIQQLQITFRREDLKKDVNGVGNGVFKNPGYKYSRKETAKA